MCFDEIIAGAAYSQTHETTIFNNFLRMYLPQHLQYLIVISAFITQGIGLESMDKCMFVLCCAV